MKVKLTDIIIKERQRVDLGDCTSLAESLAEHGQIQAIGLNGANELVWGRRRLEAARLAGWTEIEAVVRPDLTPEDEQLLEYEEDVRRKDRTWQEKCVAMGKIMRIKKDGERWTVRRMADFTGFGVTWSTYLRQIIAALNASPRDDEMWACENYTTAVKLTLARTQQKLNEELERRRSLFMAAAAPAPSVPVDLSTPAGDAQVVSTTAQAEEPPAPGKPVSVWLHGRRFAFSDESMENLIPDRALCVIGYNVPSTAIAHLRYILAKNGFAVLFFDNEPDAQAFGYAWEDEQDPDAGTQQPHFLVWNRLAQVESPWPFCPSYSYGLVLTKQEPRGNSKRSAVITAPQDTPGQLPAALVEAVLSACCPENMPVYCIGGVPPAFVAATGRTPLWYTPDPATFTEYEAGLRAYYEETIPGVEVKLREP